MIDAFLASFRLKTAYKTNSIIYSLKSIPLVKRLLPSSLYANHGLKAFATVISAIYEFFSVFFWKLFYLLFMIFLLSEPMTSARADSFVHLFFFLSIVGGFLNLSIFDPTRDKYYAMFLMRMDARAYTLSNYSYFLLKTTIGFLPLTLLFGLLAGVPIAACLLMPFFTVSVKLLMTALVLRDYAKKGAKKTSNFSKPVLMSGGVALSLAAAYIPPALGYAMTSAVFMCLCVLFLAGSAFALVYIVRFQGYRRIYQHLLKPEVMTMDRRATGTIAQKNSLKTLEFSTEEVNTKTGYAYFNDLFMKRHRKLLTRSAKRIALGAAGVFLLAAVCCLLFKDCRKAVNDFTLEFLPFFLFVMYFLNRGKVITQAMFMNCDHGMLTYRFYRQPKVILSLFAARLQSVILTDLLPSSVIALGLPLLLFLSGGTAQPLHYVALLVSILAMSVFFSVHNMVLYYLLQPYNVELEMKSSFFSIANYFTYMVCYMAMRVQVSTLLFGLLITVFCVLYIAVSLLLAYKLAPKTFKLRQ